LRRLARRSFRVLCLPLLGRRHWGEEILLWCHLEAALDPFLRRQIRRLLAGSDAALLEYAFWAPLVQAECRRLGIPCIMTLHDVIEDGVTGSALLRRATAWARLIYEPATPGQPSVHSTRSWRLVAPTGPLEAGELRWYLDQYAIWPSPFFKSRAQQMEEKLVQWGQQLYAAALPLAHTANVMNSWARVGDQAGRRFSVQVDASLEAGAPDAEAAKAREAATLLLCLPWELLHDGNSYLFQGAKPTRVRRRLPGRGGPHQPRRNPGPAQRRSGPGRHPPSGTRSRSRCNMTPALHRRPPGRRRRQPRPRHRRSAGIGLQHGRRNPLAD
jgi:hypothetical protein